MNYNSNPRAYDPFAWIYNKHWGNSFLPVLMPIIENLALSRLPKKAKILDLCCGTGQMAGELASMSFRVTGIDGSEEMLKYARRNAPGIKFIHADARSFTLPQKYDAVISAFDSLNHMMNPSDLEQVFESVFNALKPGGIFLFDLNTEEGFEQEWRGDFNIIRDDHACIVLQTYDSLQRIATYDITIFKLNGGNWRRTDVKLEQKYHPPTRIRSQLKKVGFTNIELSGFDWNAGLKPLTRESRRMFFLCIKPK